MNRSVKSIPFQSPIDMRLCVFATDVFGGRIRHACSRTALPFHALAREAQEVGGASAEVVRQTTALPLRFSVANVCVVLGGGGADILDAYSVGSPTRVKEGIE